jgi:hypothetical protein
VAKATTPTRVFGNDAFCAPPIVVGVVGVVVVTVSATVCDVTDRDFCKTNKNMGQAIIAVG